MTQTLAAHRLIPILTINHPHGTETDIAFAGKIADHYAGQGYTVLRVTNQNGQPSAKPIVQGGESGIVYIGERADTFLDPEDRNYNSLNYFVTVPAAGGKHGVPPNTLHMQRKHAASVSDDDLESVVKIIDENQRRLMQTRIAVLKARQGLAVASR